MNQLQKINLEIVTFSSPSFLSWRHFSKTIAIAASLFCSGKVGVVLLSRNVTFLNGKSVSRVKSFFRAVKCFSMSDPFAPRVGLCCPSLRGLAKGHERGKWITNGKTFHARIMISRGKLFTS